MCIRDSVGIVERNIGNIILFIDGDRIRAGAVSRIFFAGNRDRETKIDGISYRVAGRVDDREAVAISIGDQQVLSVERQSGGVVTGRDAAGNCKRSQIDHGNGAGGRGASRVFGDHRGAVGVELEVVRGSNPAGFVGDVGGSAVGGDQDTVRDVTDANLRCV